MMDAVLGAVITIRFRCPGLATVQEIAAAGSMEKLIREAAEDGLLWTFIDETDEAEVLSVVPLEVGQ